MTKTSLSLLIVASATFVAAQLNPHGPWFDGDAWVASTYNGHGGVGTWYAVDFNRSGDAGAPVYATHSGYATMTRSRGNFNGYGPYGNFVTIYDGRLKTLIAHLVGFNGSSRYVNAGDHIGWCGRTGQASGEHIHLETWWDGRRVDVRSFKIDDQWLFSGDRGGTVAALRNYTAEGQMAKMINRAEVYYVVGGARWWVRDDESVRAFGGWSNVFGAREDTLYSLPEAHPRPRTMYRMRNYAPVFVENPFGWPGRWWIMSGAGVEYFGGWGQVRLVPDNSFSLNDYAGTIF